MNTLITIPLVVAGIIALLLIIALFMKIAWNGNKDVGEGEKEIMKIIEGKRIETQIRFVRPMATIANIIMETESLSDDQTKVYMSNAGTLKYPINIMIPICVFPSQISTENGASTISKPTGSNTKRIKASTNKSSSYSK